MAYPVYEDNGGIAAGQDYGVDVPYPSTVNADDILIILMLDADNDTFTTPGGWNPIQADSASNNCSFATFWKRATGSESGTETVNSVLDAGQLVCGVMFRFSGCLTSGTPFESDEQNAVSQTTSPASDQIDTLGSERLVCCLLAIEDNIILTGHNNYSDAAQVATTTGSDAQLALATLQQAIADTVSAETFSLATTEYTGTVTLALIPSSTVNHYTLETIVGAFTLTGVATTKLLKDSVISSSVGAFTLTGVATTNLLKGSIISSGVGAFTLTGIDLSSLLKDSVISSSVGEFALTGIDVNLTYSGGSYILDCEVGAFALTGINANLLASKIISASVGTFALTGINTNLLKSSLLSPQVGSFTFTGINSNLLKGFRINPSVGTFVLSGINANLLKGSILSPGVGEFTLTGINLDLLASRILSGSAGDFTLTGLDIILTYNSGSGSYTLECEAGTFALTGVQADLVKSSILSAEKGTFVLTGMDVIFVTGDMYKIVNVASSAKYPGITFSEKQPVVRFEGKKPSITFIEV